MKTHPFLWLCATLLTAAAPCAIAQSTNNATPVVTWLQPTNGARFSPGMTILLRARATDTDGAVNFVDFFASSTNATMNLGRVGGVSTNVIYTLPWSNAPAGTFQLHAEAVDNLGGRGISVPVQIIIGAGGTSNAPPTIVSQPQSQTVTNGADVTFSVSATGTPPLGYRWRKNGIVLPLATNSTLTLLNVTSNSAGLYSVIVSNMFGFRTSSNALLTVISSPNTNNAAPTVTWLQPTNAASFPTGSGIVLTARATDSDGRVSFVEFYANSNFLGRVLNSTNAFATTNYNFVWSNAPAGTFRLHAEAVDNSGARGVSGSVQTVVTGGGGTNNIVPVVTWIRPTNGTRFPSGSSIPLTARATDSGGTISFVDFFASSSNATMHLGRVSGLSTNSLYNFVWSNAPAGIFQLHAEARDNLGGRGVSDPVQIVVGGGGGGSHVVDVGTVQVSTIGHTFSNPSFPGIMSMPSAVVDHLIDQDQSSGGGGLLPSVSVSWDTNTRFALTVSAPPGHKFLVRVPAGRAVGFGGFLWWESTRGGFSPPGTVAARFDGLEGTPPVFSSSEAVLSDSHGFFGFADLDGTKVTSDFAFTAVTLTGTVTPQFTGNGTEHYIPHRESTMVLAYTTTEATDPGRFVSIVPVDADTNNVAPIARIRIENGVTFLDHPTVISLDGTVILNGSQSSDGNHDPLTYAWSVGEPPVAFATGVRVSHQDAADSYVFQLQVSDGELTGTDHASVNVLTPCDAIGLLMLRIAESPHLSRITRPLIRSLEMSCDRFDRGDVERGIQLLEAFQHKVVVQLRSVDPALAALLIEATQTIIDAVPGG